MDFEMLSRLSVFHGLEREEIYTALSTLRAEEKNYQKGAVIFHAGSVTERMGLILEGSATIESNDIWGNRTILSHVGHGQVFGESYALLTNVPMQVDVTANENCRILFLRIGFLAGKETNSEPWALKLTANLLRIFAYKNLHLTGRSFHTSPKTIRGRVMAYLNAVYLQTGTREFDIPFDRQQLADYLNLERTALSKELGRMQREGYFRTKKRHFVILRSEILQIGDEEEIPF